MFDIGMSEMVVVGVVALIVVGPKDLPQMFRKVGQFVGKARGMARDFQRAMDQAADESGVGDVSATLKQATSMKNLGLDDAAKHLRDFQDEHSSKKEPKKIDAAAEHKARVEAVEEANKAAGKWPPDYMTDAAAEDAVAEKPAAKKTTTKKTTTNKTTAKKAAAKKPAAKKAPAKKSPAKKPASKATAKKPTTKTAAKKPNATKATAKKTTKSAKADT
ncbi:MAG: twin-arginine translocase subunit TatB [Rhodobacteraceae bacterium]|nr:twin-arginine translocase subunit TatB [Paracoccaceae bacterium]